MVVFKLRKAFEKIVYVRPYQFQVKPHDLALLILLRSGRNVRLTPDLVAFTPILNQSIPSVGFIGFIEEVWSLQGFVKYSCNVECNPQPASSPSGDGRNDGLKTHCDTIITENVLWSGLSNGTFWAHAKIPQNTLYLPLHLWFRQFYPLIYIHCILCSYGISTTFLIILGSFD